MTLRRKNQSDSDPSSLKSSSDPSFGTILGNASTEQVLEVVRSSVDLLQTIPVPERAEPRSMPERKDVSASIETSDDYLPDFRKMVEYGRQTTVELTNNVPEISRTVKTAEDAEVVINLEKFRKVLSQTSFDPLLIELAVVQERKLDRSARGDGATADDEEEQHFTSFMTSYLGRFDERSLIIQCWNQAIAKLLKPPSGSNKKRFSLMAYQKTYESSYLAEQFNWAVVEMRRVKNFKLDEDNIDNLADMLVDARSRVFGKLKSVYKVLDEAFPMPAPKENAKRAEQLQNFVRRVSEENAEPSPTVYRSVYRFSLIPQEHFDTNAAVNVEGAVSYLVAQFVSSVVSLTERGHRSEDVKAILDFLMNCCLLIVPFRRPIAYDPRAYVDHDFSWGDSPGGCLFVLARPRLGSMANDHQLDDLARRFSIVLSRAALRESHVSAKVETKMHQHKDAVMRLLTHHIPSTIKDVVGALDFASAHLEGTTPANVASAQSELTLANEWSKQLLTFTDLMIHAYKVEVGAAKPKPLGTQGTVSQILKEIEKNTLAFRASVSRNSHNQFQVNLSGTSNLRMEAALYYDSVYLGFVLQELLRNVYKHAADPVSEINIEIDGNNVFLLISNNIKGDVDVNAAPKSRLGLIQLEAAATAYELIRPSCKPEPSTLRFISKLQIAKLKPDQVDGDK